MEKKQFRVLRKTVWDTLKAFPKGHHREAIVLLYLESGPITDWTGLFSAPAVDIAHATGLDAVEVQLAIMNLNQWGHIVYDFDRRVVFVKGLLFRQARFKPNWKQATGIIRHVENFSENSPAVQAFFSEHAGTPSLAGHFPKPKTLELVNTSSKKAEGYPLPHSDGVTKGTPMRIKKQETRNKKRETNVSLPSEATALRAGESDKPPLETIPANDELTGPTQQGDTKLDVEALIAKAVGKSEASPVPAFGWESTPAPPIEPKEDSGYEVTPDGYRIHR